MRKSFKYFDFIVAVFAASLLISNFAATKLIEFNLGSLGHIVTDGGAILFPVVYILNDVLTEVYGYKYARRAIWTGFVIMLLAVVCLTIVRYMPASPDYHDQAAFEAVLGFFPRIVFASLCAYLVGEFINAYALAKLKIKTKGKKLWLRLIGSTLIGEFFDSLVFCLVAFGGIIGASDMVNYILVGWLFKTGYEIVVLPITYRVINYLKRKEGVDAYDNKTDFTPLSTSI
ncbi:queuosine precursor transporter [Candidatus Saccharibacteria bacterium]|nr:queuosine precursor transporter [Candidatus Saccharibacteria bacterium]